VVFSIILGQIESYDNLIKMMVDSFKYLSPIGLDVMSHSLLCATGGGGGANSGREKLKNDGLNATQWLASLEQFIGVFYRKFPQVELRGLLSFVTLRLKAGHVLELGGECAKRASLEKDENTRDGSREMAEDGYIHSKLTHSIRIRIRLVRSCFIKNAPRFARRSAEVNSDPHGRRQGERRHENEPRAA